MNLILRIGGNYNKLSKSNKKIADVILKNPEEILSLSTLKIGEITGTSSASITRFAKHFGFTSLENFKISLAKDALELANDGDKDEIVDTIILPEDDLNQLVSKLSNITVKTLETVKYQLDIKKLETAIEMIEEANTVYLLGIGSSGIVAYDLYRKLNRLGKKSMYSMDSHTNIEHSYYSTENDIMIVFSYSGETRECIVAARQAKENGSKLIVITRDRTSTLSKIGDVVINIPDNENIIRIGAVNSKVSSMFIADLLFLGTMQKQMGNIKKDVIATSKLVGKLK